MSTDVEKQEGQKTVVSFAAGLLIGGLLVWAFSGSPETDESRTVDVQTSDDATEMTDGEEDSANTSEESAADTDSDTESTTNETPAMTVGDASVELGSVTAGSMVTLEGATFPTDEGWVGVRSYTDGEFGNILGVSRYSNEQGLVPSQIELLAPTTAGNEYAVVFFAEDGDRDFNPALDAQLDTEVITFTAE